MGKDIGLSEVESALKGSKFSVPRDRLRLFGHVVLEIDAGAASTERLMAEVEGLDYASVEKSEEKNGVLVVTVDMPYPVDRGSSKPESIGWDKFARSDFSSDQSTKSEPPATPRQLPAHRDFREIVSNHKGSLKDIRWDTSYACRPLGGIADADAQIAAKQKPQS
jgi:hypothetical protein